MWKSLPSLAVSVAVAVVLAGCALAMIGSIANARPLTARDAAVGAIPSKTLERALDGLESLRSEKAVRKAIDLVKENLSTTNIRSSQDFLVAAKIAQMGSTPEDALLAHDLACCALAMGQYESRTIVATAMDQFLQRTGRVQSFGTQKDSPRSEVVTEGMRFIMGVEGVRSSSGSGKELYPTQLHSREVRARLNMFVAP